MARNQEKSQSMLNRWYNFKIGNEQDVERASRRPPHASMTRTVKAAEHWRRTVIKEFNEKLGMIQNASLGEHRIRDLNDDLNKLLREKYSWEVRIVELNGPDYRTKGKLYDDQGNTIDTSGSTSEYMYFGAARELDGVRDMLKEAKKRELEKAAVKKKFTPPAQYYYYSTDEAQLREEAKYEEMNVNQSIQQTDQAHEFKNESSISNFEIFDYSQWLKDDHVWSAQLLDRKRQMLLSLIQ